VSVPTLRFRFNPDTPRLRARVYPAIPPLQVTFRNTGTMIQWRLGESGAWQDLIEIDDINASVTVGSTTTLAPGEDATVVNSGTDQDVILDFGIPEGIQGDAATIDVGTVTTVGPADPPTVVNSGTTQAAILDFDLPSAATIAVGTVDTVLPGDPATVTNSGTSVEAVLDFEIPQGEAATIAVGTVTTVDPSDPATVTNIGTTGAAIFDFDIPRGAPGTGSVDSVNGDAGPDITLDAGDIPFTPAGTIAATDVQAALQELDGDIGAIDVGVESVVGDGSVEVDITDPANPVVSLDGDADTPGNNKVYGTDGSGVKGWKNDPAGGSAATTTAAGIVEQQFNAFYNIGLACSVGSSALTIALKDAEGNDPSASSPVIIPFRNVTAGTGTPSYLTITAATSLAISSGSTMAFTSGAVGRLWIVGFNDGGTFRLGAVNALSGTSIMALRDGIYSSTAEGGAGGADTAQVIYTGTAVTSQAMVVLGYIEATEATAGTWATAPSLVQVRSPGDKLPGDIVQRIPSQTGSSATGTTVMPQDNTIPQITEGDQFMTNAITPRSGANVLSVDARAYISSSTTGGLVTMALFQDATSNALAVMSASIDAAGRTVSIPMLYNFKSNTTSSTTLRIRAGNDSAATQTFNGSAGSGLFGGVITSCLNLTEIMA
jgi:hypothetical protein